MKRLRLVVLASGGGRSLQNLIERSTAGTLRADVVHVIASRPGIGALERAAKSSIPGTVCGADELTPKIDALAPDLVVMAGWLRRWTIPDRWIGRAINIHPALLPKFGGKGLYGHRVHEAVLAAGEKTSGCTVHWVTAEYDAGPVVLQRTCPVLEGDTADALAARVFVEEIEALPAAIAMIAEGRAVFPGGNAPRGPSPGVSQSSPGGVS